MARTPRKGFGEGAQLGVACGAVVGERFARTGGGEDAPRGGRGAVGADDGADCLQRAESYVRPASPSSVTRRRAAAEDPWPAGPRRSRHHASSAGSSSARPEELLQSLAESTVAGSKRRHGVADRICAARRSDDFIVVGQGAAGTGGIGGQTGSQRVPPTMWCTLSASSRSPTASKVSASSATDTWIAPRSEPTATAGCRHRTTPGRR